MRRFLRLYARSDWPKRSDRPGWAAWPPRRAGTDGPAWCDRCNRPYRRPDRCNRGNWPHRFEWCNWSNGTDWPDWPERRNRCYRPD